MDKKSRDNRANQLNPNNPLYYKSRGSKTAQPKKSASPHPAKNTNSGNKGKPCKLCGKAGKLRCTDTISSEARMVCGYCGGSFWVKR